MQGQAADNLANNLRQLREARGLTQEQVARSAGLPRPTWANLESGGANPTLSVLIKAAHALQVSVEELIGPPRASAKLYRADAIPIRKRGRVRIRQLLPESIAGFLMERIELPPGAGMSGVPHTPGTREYLTCERGEIELTESGKTWRLSAGDVVVFRGDQKHGYHNPGRHKTIAYSVVSLAPAAS